MGQGFEELAVSEGVTCCDHLRRRSIRIMIYPSRTTTSQLQRLCFLVPCRTVRWQRFRFFASLRMTFCDQNDILLRICRGLKQDTKLALSFEGSLARVDGHALAAGGVFRRGGGWLQWLGGSVAVTVFGDGHAAVVVIRVGQRSPAASGVKIARMVVPLLAPTSIDQQIDGFFIAPVLRIRQRGFTPNVSAIHIGPCINQHLRYGRVTFHRSPMQRGTLIEV